LSAFESCTGVVSSEQNFSISGESLTANIEIAALSGYEYSTDNTTYTATLSLPFGGGTVSSTPIYVRLTSSATGTPAGNIVCSSTGATDQNIAVSGEVLSNPLTQVALAVDDRPCGNTATGSATISLTGGDAPYTYTWTLNGSAFTASPASAPTNLSAGTYVVTVTDACNNQVASNSISVTSAPSLSLNSSVTPAQNATIACNGDQTASITAEIQGGTAPRTLTVTNTGTGTSYSSSTPTGPPSLGSFPYEVTGLPAGTYTVTASDGTSSCEDTYSNVVISEPTALAQTNLVTDACFGTSTGSIDVTVTGGTAPYTYSWSNGATTQDISTLAAGDYTLTVTDANGCTLSTGAITVSEPAAALSSTNSVTAVDCNGASTGSIAVTVSGGTTAYSYDWSGPNGFTATTEDISTLAAGDYTLAVTDANGCTLSTGAITVSEPAALSSTNSVTAVDCNGASTGSIDVTVSGGTTAYSYDWSGPNGFTATTEDISTLAAGDYTLAVTDANGCTLSTGAITVSEPAALSSTNSVTAVDCNGASTGSIAVTVSGGTTAYSYDWSGPNGFTATTEDISTLAAGDYTLAVTDANGCTLSTGAITVSEPAAALSSTNSVTAVDCNGASTGSIAVTVSGGTTAYSYDWSGPNGFTATTEDISTLAAGDYTLAVTDANGCTLSTGAITVSEPAALSSTNSVTAVDCNGASTGSIDVTVSGGTTAYSYDWSGPNGFTATTEDISTLAAGDYTLAVTDANGCTLSTGAITVSEPAALSSTNSVTAVDCNGASTGSIAVTVSGGTTAYSYDWSGPNGFTATTEDISTLAAGDYTLAVTDANGCTLSTGAITVSEPAAALSSTNSVTAVDCNGASTGSIDVTVSGGTTAYSYAWSGPNGFTATTEDISTLAAGDYTLAVTDANGCTLSTGAITVSEPAALSSTNSVTAVDCNGASTGSIDVTVSGGTTAYSYAWSGPNGFTATTEDISTLAAGDYTLAVTDANGCTLSTGAITVSEPAALSSTNSVTAVDCNGASTGSIDVTVSGGTTAYSYAWSGPNGFTATTEDISTLAAGDYTLAVTDANGCTLSTGAITVSEPAAALSSTNSVTAVDCNGASTGSIDVTVSGGTTAYSYAWSGPNGFTATTEDISTLAAGDYTLAVTDANGCTLSTGAITVSEPAAALSSTNSVTAVDCNGASTGSIDVTVSGGTTAYSYAWSGPNGFTATTEDISTLAAGDYTLAVTDANGCTLSTGAITVSEPAALSSTNSVTAVDCNGASTGSIDVTVSGGTTAYSYAWSGPNGFTATTEDISTLAAGDYTLAVTDANGCTLSTGAITVSEPAALSSTNSVTAVDCNGASTGSIDVTVSGGTTAYSYAWSGPNGFTATTEDISTLAAGDYTLAVTDANGCTLSTGAITVSEPAAALSSTNSVTAVDCNGASTGSIDVTVSGGTTAYSYAWSGPNGFTATTEDISTLAAGDYTLAVTDANGCTLSTGAITVSEPAALSSTNSVTAVDCNGASTGSIDVTVSGGTTAYSYAWSGPNGFTATTEDISTLAAGDYTLAVTDANGCTLSTGAITVSEPAALSSTNSVTAVDCNGASTGSIDVTVSGGTTAYSYDWSGPNGFTATTEDISTLAAGDYTLAVTDANGCTLSTGAITVSEPAALSVTNDPISDASCFNTSDGNIPINVSGGTSPYSYAWSGPNGFTATTEDLVFNAAPGTYSLIVTDDVGCTETLSNLVVGSPSAVSFSFSTTNVDCNGASTGAIDLTATGGSPAYAFSWTQDGSAYSNQEDLTNLPAGDYAVTVTDGNFCVFTSNTVTIDEPALYAVSVSAVDATVCSGLNGQYTLTGTAGHVVTYNVNGGANTTATIGGGGSVVVTLTGITVDQTLTLVSVTDATNTCSNTVTGNATITINALPNVSAGVDQTVCNGVAVTLSGSGATSYIWDNGITNNSAFTTSNTTNAPVTTTYTVTGTDANGCENTDAVDVTVNPTPTVDAVTSQELCDGASTSVTFASTFNVSGTTYSWVNDNTGIGLAASGSGNIPSFAVSNSGTTDIVATITVTPSANGCDGTAETFTITVKPTPTVDQQADITYCGGVAQSPIVFTGSTSNTVYDWTSSQNVGFFASGTANPQIGGYVIDPAAQVVSTVIVTPQNTAGGVTCSGSQMQFTVTVNPTPSIGDVTQTICSAGSFTVTPTNTNTNANSPFDGDLVPANTTYSWSAPTVSGITGLASGSSANSISGTLTNTTNAAIDVTYTVTPTSGENCAGSTFDVVVTVDPVPSVVAQTASVCTGVAFSVAPANGSGNIVPVGTTYDWAAPSAITGISNLSSGTAETTIGGTLSNSTSAPIDVVYSVTPTSGSCVGSAFNVAVTVNPTPVVSDQTVTSCSGSTFTVAPVDGNNSDVVPSNTTYSWSAPAAVTGITGLASGTNEANFSGNLTNTTNAAIDVTYTLTPTSGTCQGATFDVVVTVDPVPSVVAQTASVCTGVAFSVAPANGSGNIVPVGTTYDWAAPSAITGISNLSSGTAETTIGGTLSNSTSAPIDVVYSVTPTSGSCVGSAFNVTVTVNPTPVVSDQTVTSCSGSTFTVAPVDGNNSDVVPSNTTYSWSAPAAVTGITGLASGTNEANFSGNLTNTTNAAIDVTYTLTPTSGTCQGATFDVVVTVDPTPSIADESTAICSGDAFSVVPSSSSVSNASDLFISEYVEGSGTNKYIEIFNGTGGSVDLSDYRLRLYSNGASTPNNDVILSGTLANNSTLVYSNSSATAYTGSSTANSAVGFNGDDAVALYNISSSSFVDVFGRIGDDPGSAWSAGGNSTANKTLVRNSNITGGVTASPTGTGPTAFTTLSTEWSQSNQDDVSNLGTHTYGTSNGNIIPTGITYSWPSSRCNIRNFWFSFRYE
jgi:hypothetical protein